MNKRNTRDLGIKGGGAGKGDAPRYTHNETWIANYDAINWGHNQSPPLPDVPPEESCASLGNCDCHCKKRNQTESR